MRLARYLIAALTLTGCSGRDDASFGLGQAADASDESTPGASGPGGAGSGLGGAATDAGADGPTALSPHALNDQQVSHGRMRAEWRVTAAGAAEFVAWQDTQIDTTCSFMTAADGKVRCLPYSGKIALENGLYFSDAACSQVVHVSAGGYACAVAPTLIGVPDYTQCPARERIYGMGAKLALTQIYYRSGPADPCQSMPSRGWEVYALGPEVPASTYVEGTATESAAAGGVAAAYLSGPDGWKSFRGLRDTKANADCSVARTGDGQTRCVPSTNALVSPSSFGDAACTQGDAYVAGLNPICAPPAIAASYDGNDCTPGVSFYALGKKEDGYWFKGGSCIAQTPTPSVPHYTIGAQIAPSTFPVASPAPPVTFGALQATIVTLPGDLPYRTSWRDTVHDADCTFDIAADGALRCVPSSAAGRSAFFADAACTRPLAVTYDGCQPPKFALTIDDTACPYRRQYAPLGAPFAGALYAMSGSSCAATPTPKDLHFFELGPETPASSFVEATIELR